MFTDGFETTKAQRSRRHIVKMAAVLGPVLLARTAQVRAASRCASSAQCKCFLKGSKILTVDGERKVEDLAIGDRLPTLFGGVRPIQWIGRYPLKKTASRKSWALDARPVRIAPSALAPGVPHAELYVTGGHALFIDGLLVPAECLINGSTITRYEAREFDELEFFHVKLETHDVIYAEGAPVDTLLTVDERAVNFAEYFRRYGAQRADEKVRCAPLVSFAGGRGELKSRMRSAVSPWFDRREPLDVIRDRLEERGLMLTRQAPAAA